MNMFCYILGSGIMDKPYAVEIAISICVMVMFGYLMWYGFKRAASVRKEWMSWCVALCGAVAFVAFFPSVTFLRRLYVSTKRSRNPLRKLSMRITSI
jgi:hypothetical protein